jgi:hypothetical protein
VSRAWCLVSLSLSCKFDTAGPGRGRTTHIISRSIVRAVVLFRFQYCGRLANLVTCNLLMVADDNFEVDAGPLIARARVCVCGGSWATRRRHAVPRGSHRDGKRNGWDARRWPHPCGPQKRQRPRATPHGAHGRVRLRDPLRRVSCGTNAAGKSWFGFGVQLFFSFSFFWLGCATFRQGRKYFRWFLTVICVSFILSFFSIKFYFIYNIPQRTSIDSHKLFYTRDILLSNSLFFPF